MNRNLERILIFLAGGIAGSLAMYKLINVRYAELTDKEINSVKEMYKIKLEELEEKKTYKDILEDNEYVKKDIESTNKLKETLEETDEITKETLLSINEDVSTSLEEYKDPYVITPDQYGENPDYEMTSLTLYSDGVLCDENDEEITDIENLLGNTLETFDIFDDDSLFVRNDSRKQDYEIIRVTDRRYGEDV